MHSDGPTGVIYSDINQLQERIERLEYDVDRALGCLEKLAKITEKIMTVLEEQIDASD